MSIVHRSFTRLLDAFCSLSCCRFKMSALSLSGGILVCHWRRALLSFAGSIGLDPEIVKKGLVRQWRDGSTGTANVSRCSSGADGRWDTLVLKSCNFLCQRVIAERHFARVVNNKRTNPVQRLCQVKHDLRQASEKGFSVDIRRRGAH
jgi:hypothetical protein